MRELDAQYDVRAPGSAGYHPSGSRAGHGAGGVWGSSKHTFEGVAAGSAAEIEEITTEIAAAGSPEGVRSPAGRASPEPAISAISPGVEVEVDPGPHPSPHPSPNPNPDPKPDTNPSPHPNPNPDPNPNPSPNPPLALPRPLALARHSQACLA